VAAPVPELSKARGRRLVLIGNLISCTLLTLGIIGMLQTKLESTEDVTIITVHPVTAVVWFALGAVGVAMSLEARRARLYLAATGAVLTLWGLLCLALDGTPSDVFARDPALVALLLVGGLLSLGVALAPPILRLQRAHP
jgi:peptidoglycan/LPS O-acetylase OafA/YrhL